MCPPPPNTISVLKAVFKTCPSGSSNLIRYSNNRGLKGFEHPQANYFKNDLVLRTVGLQVIMTHEAAMIQYWFQDTWFCNLTETVPVSARVRDL